MAVDSALLPDLNHSTIRAAADRYNEAFAARNPERLQAALIDLQAVYAEVGKTAAAVQSLDDVNRATSSNTTAKLTLSEATTSLEVIRRLDAWAPREREALLTLPAMPEPILDKLILPGTVAVAPGEGGAGKTTIFIAMNMAIATGTDFLCFSCRSPGSSVHLLAEDDQHRAEYTLTRSLIDERAQLKAEGWSASAIEEYTEDVRKRVRLVSVRGVAATLAVSEFGTYRVSATVDALCRALEKITDLRTVTLDTLSRFAGVPLDSNDSAPIVLTALERIAERTGAFVLATHHTGKNAAREKNEDQYSARGASAITDNARLVLRLRPLDKAEITKAGLMLGTEQQPRDYLRLSVPKSNYFPRPDPITICRAGFLFRMAKAAAGQDVSGIYRGQLSMLNAAIDDLHRQQLRASTAALEKVSTLGSRNHTREIIKTLTTQGWLERQGSGPKTEIAVTKRGLEVLRMAGEVAATSSEDAP